MAVRGGWRPLSGLICEIVNSVGQGNFTFVREKSGKSQGISNTYGCGNHEHMPHVPSTDPKSICYCRQLSGEHTFDCSNYNCVIKKFHFSCLRMSDPIPKIGSQGLHVATLDGNN